MELLSPVYLIATGTPGILAAVSNPQHPAHGFDAELSLMLFDKEILHFRRFAKYVAAILENGQLLVPFSQLTFKPNDLCSLFTFALRGRCLVLLFATLGIELRFIQTEFTSNCSDANAFSKFKDFLAEFGCVLLMWLFTGFLLAVTDFVM